MPVSPTSWSRPMIRADGSARSCRRMPIRPRGCGSSSKHPDYVSDTGGYSRRLSLKTARAMTGALVMSSGVNVSGQVRDGNGQTRGGGQGRAGVLTQLGETA